MVVPVADAEQVPLDRNTPGQRLFVTGTHDDTVPVGQDLVSVVIDSKSTVDAVSTRLQHREISADLAQIAVIIALGRK